jgi:hypothetical protein
MDGIDTGQIQDRITEILRELYVLERRYVELYRKYEETKDKEIEKELKGINLKVNALWREKEKLLSLLRGWEFE